MLSGGWLGWQPLAHANLGETYSQINARYGQPVTGFDAPSHDKSEFIHVYQINDRRIYVTIINGKSCCEAVRTPPNQMSETMALAIAAKISGVTNWTEQKRNAEEVQWLGDTIWVNMGHHPNADIVFVQTLQYLKDEMNRESQSWMAVHMSGTNLTNSKPDMAAHILKSQQELADKGDAYGELRMGLRYRDGDGVPMDLDKAREMLQKSADQGDSDATTALSELSKPQNPILSVPTNSVSVDPDLVLVSAEFGMGKNMADVTARVGELLRSAADGFTADAKTLGTDPLPGKKKRLVIKYDYQGIDHVLVVQAGKYFGKEALVKNAIK